MTTLQVLTWGDTRLKVENLDVGDWSPELDRLVADMFETMVAQEGAGLAAPQVGMNINLAVIDVTSEPAGKRMILINPEIIREEGQQLGSEGCLSIPGITEMVNRPMKVWVKNRKPDGTWEEIEAEGLAARAVSHEIDHLRGRLFVERLGPVKQGIVRRKYQKLRKG